MDVWKVTAHRIRTRDAVLAEAAAGPEREDWVVNATGPADALDQASQEAAAAEAVKVLAAPGALPGLFHCAVGKDRTGFLAAVILALLGVPDEEIISDFMISNAELGFPESGEPVNVPTLPSRSAIRPELLADALDRIRRQYGDIATYLRAGGVTDLELESLTDALTDRG